MLRTFRNSAAKRGLNLSGWRCFASTFTILVALMAVNLAGCGGGGGGGIGGDGNNGNGSPVLITVRNPATGTLLPASGSAVVRIAKGGFTRSVTITSDAPTASFTNIPAGTYQVFYKVGTGAEVRQSPDIVVLAPTQDDTGSVASQRFQVIRRTNAAFTSSVVITGRTRLLSIGLTPTPGATPTPGSPSSCPANSFPVNRSYLLFVRDLTQTSRPVVAIITAQGNAQGEFSVSGLPLQVVGGQPVSTTFVLEARSDPSVLGTPFSGRSAAFTVGKTTSSNGDPTVALPDICANESLFDIEPVPTATPFGIPTQPGF